MVSKKGMGALNPLDIINKRFGKLVAVELIPEDKRKNKNKNREWLCQCDCGNTVVVEQRNLTGVKYQQHSCGCIREKAHLVATSKMPLTMEYVEKFNDFKKYAFLHKTFVKFNKDCTDFQFYSEFMDKFYNEKQFNAVYNNWNNKYKTNINNTFYNWYKPSLDHILPKSKGGKNEVSNYQFLTVFENLGKRDMTNDEWNIFLGDTNTQSDLFVINILKKEGLDIVAR